MHTFRRLKIYGEERKNVKNPSVLKTDYKIENIIKKKKIR